MFENFVPTFSHSLYAQAINHLSKFFYTNAVALHLIEDEHLIAAFSELGCTLVSRKVLSTTMLNAAYLEIREKAESNAAMTGLLGIARQAAAGRKPLLLW